MNALEFARATDDSRTVLENAKPPLPALVVALALDEDEPVPFWPAEGKVVAQ